MNHEDRLEAIAWYAHMAVESECKEDCEYWLEQMERIERYEKGRNNN